MLKTINTASAMQINVRGLLSLVTTNQIAMKLTNSHSRLSVMNSKVCFKRMNY
jgi:hypothetical protein